MKKDKSVNIGSVIVVEVMNDNNVISGEMYQIEQFYPAFILCRHLKGGYRECFSPHELYQSGVINWNQRIHYNNLTGFAFGG